MSSTIERANRVRVCREPRNNTKSKDAKEAAKDFPSSPTECDNGMRKSAIKDPRLHTVKSLLLISIIWKRGSRYRGTGNVQIGYRERQHAAFAEQKRYEAGPEDWGGHVHASTRGVFHLSSVILHLPYADSYQRHIMCMKSHTDNDSPINDYIMARNFSGPFSAN